jgi:mono/diheme cytochrome c family protein
MAIAAAARSRLNESRLGMPELNHASWGRFLIGSERETSPPPLYMSKPNKLRTWRLVMKLLVGIAGALFIIALGGFLFIVGGLYNVAATSPDLGLENLVLHSTMRYSVQARAGTASKQSWSDVEIGEGFKDYDAMCVVCHAAPSKERSAISKGMRPQPPTLAQASKQWSNGQLFWIIKNGVKMTGMPAFGVTHDDDQIWNIVGFVLRLSNMSTQQYEAMEKTRGAPGDHHDYH